MEKQEIIRALQESYNSFFQLMESFSSDEFNKASHDKWSPHQNLDHIKRAVYPLTYAYTLPKWMLNLVIGKSNRPSKTYPELIEKYCNKLNAGGKASGRYIPPKKITHSREKLIQETYKYLLTIETALVHNWTEEQLDKYIFPHPLLGKLTAREMLYFTIYHAQHHADTVRKYYVS